MLRGWPMTRRDFWVSFQSLLADDDPHEPPGGAIACRLREHLAAQGVQCDPVENWRDCGHSVDCTIDSLRIYWFVTWVDPANTWVVCCTADRGVFRRLFRRVGGQQQLVKLADAMHRALEADDNFGEIRWYPYGWHGLGNDRWVATPIGGDDQGTLG